MNSSDVTDIELAEMARNAAEIRKRDLELDDSLSQDEDSYLDRIFDAQKCPCCCGRQ